MSNEATKMIPIAVGDQVVYRHGGIGTVVEKRVDSFDTALGVEPHLSDCIRVHDASGDCIGFFTKYFGRDALVPASADNSRPPGSLDVIEVWGNWLNRPASTWVRP